MRQVGSRIRGLTAVLGILALVVGVPVVLVAVGASLVPTSMPSWSGIWNAVTSPDDGTALLAAVKVIGWAAWLFITVSVLLEVAYAIRGLSAPTLPGLSLPQGMARGLVSTAALLFVALPSVAVATVPASHAIPVTSVQTVSAAAQSGAPASSRPAAGVPAPVAADSSTSSHARAGRAASASSYTVHDGDTLWSIAQSQLGNGERYREIATLNYHRTQPDGHHLDKTHWIRTGWVLQIPARTSTAAASSPAAQTAVATAPTRPAATTTREVKVRDGDNLWDVTQRELGSGSRFHEVFDASTSITQPDGRHLTNPNKIYTGWTLNVPVDTAPTVITPSAPAPPAASPAAPPTTPPPLTGPSAPVISAPVQAPAVAVPAPPSVAPATPEARQPAQSAPATSPAPVEPSPALASTSDTAPANGSPVHLAAADGESFPVRSVGTGVGALLAAGVITLLARRRRDQQRHRRPGQRLPMPAAEAAAVETDLRATADPLSVDQVDRALRGLARTCANASTALPVVRAARLTADQFDLYLAEPAVLPSPWLGTADTTVWTLPVDAAENLPADLSSTPAPYPALVTIGHDTEDGHVFLDLEYLGTLAIAGSPTDTQEVLAAIAVELATSSWADNLQVTVVGAFPEMEDALQTGRLRYLPSAGRILEELGTRAEQDRAALAADHSPDLQHARVTGAAADAWAPEIVLLAGVLTERQRNQLQVLVDELPRVAIAAVTAGASVGEWSLDMTGGNELAVLSPIGLQIHPQRIDKAAYGHILDMVSLTDADCLDGDEDAAPELTAGDLELITTVDEPKPVGDQLEATPAGPEPVPSQAAMSVTVPVPDALAPEVDEQTTITLEDEAASEPAQSFTPTNPATVTAPYVKVIGPVEIDNAFGPVERGRRVRLLEFAAYLALNPGSTHKAIDAAIWPARKIKPASEPDSGHQRSAEDNFTTRNSATTRLRNWVGKDPEGLDYLPRHPTSGYAFLPEVTTDVQRWDALIAGKPLRASSENLEAALTLVRGRPFEGHHPRYYAWADPLTQRLTSEIADAAYELSRRRLMEGRCRAAEAAVVIALSIEPAQERLWRLRILAAHASRNPAAEQEAIDRLLTITEELECDLETETEQLLAALRTPGTDFDQLLANADL